MSRGSAVARTGNVAVSVPIAVAVPPAERLMPRRSMSDGPFTACSTRLSESDLDSLPFRLSAFERELLARLFRGIVLPSDAFFKRRCVPALVYNLNQKFRGCYRAPAVVSRCLDERKARGNFHYLELNDELFAVERRIPVAGIHYNLADVFCQSQAAILRYLAKHNYFTIEMVAEGTGLSVSTVACQLTGNLNAACKSFRFPPAIARHPGSPSLYCVTTPFAERFSLALECRICLGAYSAAEQKCILFLAEHPNSTHRQLAEHLSYTAAAVKRMVKKINERAALFGVSGITHYARDTAFRFSLSPEFASALDLKPKEKHELSMYFSGRQVEIIEFLAAHPNSTKARVGKGIRMDMRNASREMDKIAVVCRKRGLPEPFNIIDGHNSRCSLARRFADAFDIETASASPESFLPPYMHRVYFFFKARPSATTADAARKFRISRHTVQHYARRINKILRANGQQAISYATRHCTFKDFDAVKSYFADYRRDHGRWPTTESIREGAGGLLVVVHTRFGGIDAVRRKVWASLSDEERLEFARGDCTKLKAGENVLFSKFDGYGDTVQRAALNALCAGADVPSLTRLLKRAAGHEQALAAMNAVIVLSNEQPRS